jgi:thymidylate synthase
LKIYNEAVKAGQMPKLTKDDFIQKIAEDAEFAKQWGELPKIYGELWRRWPTRSQRTIDQLQWVVNELTEDPNAHNAIVNSWNPEYLYTMATREDASRFPICHNMYQVNIIKDKVCLQLYQRSADIFLGVPFNIASYALLTLVIAKILNREPGEFVHTFGDVHIYENHLEQVKEQLKREPLPFPKIILNDEIKTLNDFTPDKVRLENYQAHPPLKAELSVSGGLFEHS